MHHYVYFPRTTILQMTGTGAVGTALRQRVIDVLYEDEVLLFVNKPPGSSYNADHDPDEPILLELVQRIPAGRCICSSGSIAARAA